MAENEVAELEGQAPGRPRVPRRVYDQGSEPDPLYTLANERTYLAWLRLAVTLLASAVAVDRLFLERPWFGSEIMALALVAIAFGTCAIAVHRWSTTELALRRRRPLPGFSVAVLVSGAITLVGAGVLVLILVPRG